jgi:hypothetical protein
MGSPWSRSSHARCSEINDRIQALERRAGSGEQELEFHRHINEDAQRDAVVTGSNEDRLEAGDRRRRAPFRAAAA